MTNPPELHRQPSVRENKPVSRPLSEAETRRLNDKVGEEARRQAEVGQTVRGSGG